MFCVYWDPTTGTSSDVMFIFMDTKQQPDEYYILQILPV